MAFSFADTVRRSIKGRSGTSWGGLEADARSRLGSASGRARESRGQYQGAVAGFDPTEYMRTAAGAAFGDLSEGLEDNRSARAASLNRRGLFKSDLGGGQEKRGFEAQLARALAGLSMQAGQMEQTRHAHLGRIHESDRDDEGRYFDATVGLGASRLQQRSADKASKRGMWGNIISGIAGGAGMALGGPAGAALGGWLGKKIGG